MGEIFTFKIDLGKKKVKLYRPSVVDWFWKSEVTVFKKVSQNTAGGWTSLCWMVMQDFSQI